jgi:hypothetical protein
MAQFDFDTIDPDTMSGTDLAALLGNFRNAIYSSNSGGTAPTYAVGGTFWVDDSDADYWPVGIFDGAAWAGPIFVIDTVNHRLLNPMGGGQETLTAASTTDLWSTAESNIIVSGNTAITKLAGSGANVGTEKTVVFTGAPKLTYHATQLILPGGIDLTVEVGDSAKVMALGSGNTRVISYARASGIPVAETPGHRKVQTKTADYTAARAADVGSLIRFDKATALTFTLATTAGQGWKVGDRIDFSQVGVGQLTLAGASGVTVNGNLKTAAQWSAGTAEYVDADTWDIYGSMSP